MPFEPILEMVRSSGGATRLRLSGERWEHAETETRAYVEVAESPKNEWARRGIPGRREGSEQL